MSRTVAEMAFNVQRRLAAERKINEQPTDTETVKTPNTLTEFITQYTDAIPEDERQDNVGLSVLEAFSRLQYDPTATQDNPTITRYIQNTAKRIFPENAALIAQLTIQSLPATKEKLPPLIEDPFAKFTDLSSLMDVIEINNNGLFTPEESSQIISLLDTILSSGYRITGNQENDSEAITYVTETLKNVPDKFNLRDILLNLMIQSLEKLFSDEKIAKATFEAEKSAVERNLHKGKPPNKYVPQMVQNALSRLSMSSKDWMNPEENLKPKPLDVLTNPNTTLAEVAKALEQLLKENWIVLTFKVGSETELASARENIPSVMINTEQVLSILKQILNQEANAQDLANSLTIEGGLRRKARQYLETRQRSRNISEASTLSEAEISTIIDQIADPTVPGEKVHILVKQLIAAGQGNKEIISGSTRTFTAAEIDAHIKNAQEILDRTGKNSLLYKNALKNFTNNHKLRDRISQYLENSPENS